MPDIVGRTATLNVRELDPSLNVEVRVVAERSLFGRRDVKVEPVRGSGSAWVNASRLALISEWAHKEVRDGDD